MAFSFGATRPSAELISTTPWKTKLASRKKFVAPHSSSTLLFNNAQRNVMSVGSTAETFFVEDVLLDWVRNARRFLKFFVSRVAKEHLSVSAFLQDNMIPTHHHAYFFLSIEDFRTLRKISWFCAAFNSVRGIFSEL